MGAFDTNPKASHYKFPYYFDDTNGINFRQELTYNGDLLIYYGSRDLDSDQYIDCWCSRWDVQSYSVIVETWLKKEDVQTLRNNTRPGAVGELYKILGKPTHYDKSWTGANTIRLVPNRYSRRIVEEGDWEKATIGGNLSYMRKDTTMYVKNLTTHPIAGSHGWIEVKIEGMVSGSTI